MGWFDDKSDAYDQVCFPPYDLRSMPNNHNIG